MKHLNTLIALIILLVNQLAKGQTATDSIKIIYKNNEHNITKAKGSTSSNSTLVFKDSIENKKVIVNVTFAPMNSNTVKTKPENDEDSLIKKVINMIPGHDSKTRKNAVEFNVLTNFSLGFTMGKQGNSPTPYNAINPNTGKSANISLDLAELNINLIKNQLLFTVGFGFNNYYLKYDNKQINQKLNTNGELALIKDTVNIYRKNRQDLRYYNVPVLLHYKSKSGDFKLSAGVEYNFNGRAKKTQKGSNENGDFKYKFENQIGIKSEQLNALVRLELKRIAFYTRIGLDTLYKESAFAANTNPDQMLYSFGVCLFN